MTFITNRQQERCQTNRVKGCIAADQARRPFRAAAHKRTTGKRARGSSKGRKGSGRGGVERREDDRERRGEPRERGSRDSYRSDRSDGSERTTGKGAGHFPAQQQNHSLRSAEVEAMYAQFANERDPWGMYQPPAGGGAVQQMHGQRRAQARNALSAAAR